MNWDKENYRQLEQKNKSLQSELDRVRTSYERLIESEQISIKELSQANEDIKVLMDAVRFFSSITRLRGE